MNKQLIEYQLARSNCMVLDQSGKHYEHVYLNRIIYVFIKIIVYMHIYTCYFLILFTERAWKQKILQQQRAYAGPSSWFLIPFSNIRTGAFWKLADSKTGARIYNRSLKHIIMPGSKEVLKGKSKTKQRRGVSRGPRSQLKGLPTNQGATELSVK